MVKKGTVYINDIAVGTTDNQENLRNIKQLRDP